MKDKTFCHIINDIEKHYIIFDREKQISVLRDMIGKNIKYRDSEKDMNYYYFESQLFERIRDYLPELGEYKIFDIGSALQDFICGNSINFNVAMVLDSDPLGIKMVEHLNRFLYFVEKIYMKQKLCHINLEIYIFYLSYFLYIFFVDFTNYIYCKFGNQNKNGNSNNSDCNADFNILKIGIRLHYDEVYYSPLPFYVQKYRELVTGCPENLIFRNVRDTVPEMTGKHLKTLELFSAVENKNEFIENFSNYLKK